MENAGMEWESGEKVCACVVGRGRTRGHAKFAEDIREVAFYGRDADEKSAGDFAVRLSARHELKNLPFAGRQAVAIRSRDRGGQRLGSDQHACDVGSGL